MGFRFVHAADLHLGCQFAGVEEINPDLKQRVMDASLRAFKNLTDYCLESDVDFLLLAGDVFETNRPSLRTQKFFVEQLARLQTANIDVFMVTGNHDAGLVKNLVFKLPKNLIMFGSEQADVIERTYNSLQVTITGISYAQQHVGDLTPLFPRPDSSSFNIAILHCEVGGKEFGYAPASLARLQSSGYDYWAIGHVHTAAEWSNGCQIRYPGVLQGRHSGETGQKGCWIVEVDSRGIKNSQFISVQDIIWQTIELDLTEVAPKQLYSTLQQAKEDQRAGFSVGTMLNLTLTGASSCYHLLKQPGTISDLLMELRDGEEQDNFVWVTGIDDQVLPEIDWNSLRRQGDFLAEVIAYIEELEANPETYAETAAVSELHELLMEHDVRELLRNAKLIAVELLSGGERK
jgi:exonuclease SbcD